MSELTELREVYQKALSKAYQADEALGKAREAYEKAREEAWTSPPSKNPHAY